MVIPDTYNDYHESDGQYLDSTHTINTRDYFDAFYSEAGDCSYLVVRFGDKQSDRALFEIDRRRFFGQASTEVLREFMRDAFFHLHDTRALDGFTDEEPAVVLQLARFRETWQKADEIFKQFLAERSNQ